VSRAPLAAVDDGGREVTSELITSPRRGADGEGGFGVDAVGSERVLADTAVAVRDRKTHGAPF